MKRVHGSYMTSEEAIAAVENLTEEGYSREQVRVISLKDCRGDCERDINIENSNKEEVKDDRTLWEKFKDIYTYSDYKQDYWNSYVEEDEVLKVYKKNLENGEILVLVDADEIK